MQAPPEVELLVGAMFVVNSGVTILVVVFRPKLLGHWMLRPRWFNASGPRAGPIGATIGALVGLVIGVCIILHSIGRLT
jgi:hypothetical protein